MVVAGLIPDSFGLTRCSSSSVDFCALDEEGGAEWMGDYGCACVFVQKERAMYRGCMCHRIIDEHR